MILKAVQLRSKEEFSQDSLKDGQTLKDVLQDNLLVVSAHCKLVKSDKAGNRTKSNLSQMGKLL